MAPVLSAVSPGKLTDDVAEFVHSWQDQAPNQPAGPAATSLPRPPCLQQSPGAMQVRTPQEEAPTLGWLASVAHPAFGKPALQ